MLHVMTKNEVEESNTQLDAWWADLDWGIKGKLRDLVWAVQHPIDRTLPMQYADDIPEPAFYFTSCSCGTAGPCQQHFVG